jgi:ribonuclease HI
MEGEAWALLHTMKEARHRGYVRVQFESDSQAVVEAICTKHGGNFEFGLIVADIINIMSSCMNLG